MKTNFPLPTFSRMIIGSKYGMAPLTAIDYAIFRRVAKRQGHVLCTQLAREAFLDAHSTPDLSDQVLMAIQRELWEAHSDVYPLHTPTYKRRLLGSTPGGEHLKTFTIGEEEV